MRDSTTGALPRNATLFIYAMLFGGIAVVYLSAMRLGQIDHLRFTSFFLVAAISSGLKVKLPGITGTLSVSSIVIFYSIVELSVPEMVSMAIVSAIIQSFWRAQVRPKLLQVSFNASNVAMSGWLAATVFDVFDLWPAQGPLLLKMATAAIAYFLFNTLSVAMIIGLTEGKNSRTIWRTCYFWSFPYYLVAASVAVSMSVASRHFGWEVGLSVVPFLFVVYRSYSLYLGQLESQKRHAEDLAALHLRTIEALALAIEAKDHTTGEHLQRVQVYSRELAKDLNLPEEQQLAIQAASILHDIGKLAVPDYIISKPGRLTPEEFDKMKVHPTVGAEILERINFPYPVVPIVRFHHEKWDGSGYPTGLKGEEIPIGARILTAVDCLDALASDRQYRKALPLKEAMGVLSSEAGKSFDPAVVKILEKRYEELDKLARLEPVVEVAQLSTQTKIERGSAPDAGFEAGDDQARGSEAASDFLASIAAARQEAQSLYEFTQDLGNSLSLSETLSVIAARVKSLIAYDSICIYLKEDAVLVPRYVGGENQKLFESLRIPLGAGLSGWVADNDKPIINGNPSVEPGYLNDPSRFSTLRSALAVPLRTEQGTIGVIALYRVRKDGFTRDHLRMVLAIASKISVAIENSISYQSAKTRAMIDGLTGLPNASALFLHLEAEMGRSKREDSTVAVLVCDLDGFKQVNDQFGHLTGNRILQKTAAAFRSGCRQYDYVARMGGDEFVVVIPGLMPGALDRRIGEFKALVRQAGRELCDSGILDVSIGAARYPDDGEDPEVILHEADCRMYRAKRTRRSKAHAEPLPNGLLELQTAVSEATIPHRENGARQQPVTQVI